MYSKQFPHRLLSTRTQSDTTMVRPFIGKDEKNKEACPWQWCVGIRSSASLWRRNAAGMCTDLHKWMPPLSREFCYRNLSYGESQTCPQRHVLQEWVTVIFHRKKLKMM